MWCDVRCGVWFYSLGTVLPLVCQEFNRPVAWRQNSLMAAAHNCEVISILTYGMTKDETIIVDNRFMAFWMLLVSNRNCCSASVRVDNTGLQYRGLFSEHWKRFYLWSRASVRSYVSNTRWTAPSWSLWDFCTFSWQLIFFTEFKSGEKMENHSKTRFQGRPADLARRAAPQARVEFYFLAEVWQDDKVKVATRCWLHHGTSYQRTQKNKGIFMDKNQHILKHDLLFFVAGSENLFVGGIKQNFSGQAVAMKKPKSSQLLICELRIMFEACYLFLEEKTWHHSDFSENTLLVK